MILILTDSNDVHADIVSMKLGDNYFRLNLDIEALKDTKISFDGSEWTISQNGKTIKNSSVNVFGQGGYLFKSILNNSKIKVTVSDYGDLNGIKAFWPI